MEIKGKITLDQLLDQLSNPDVPEAELAPYFRPVAGPTPFSVGIEFNEALVEDAVRRGQMAVNIFNTHYAIRRQRAYKARIAQGWQGVRLLAEGDSWFEYPDPFGNHDDIVDCLTDFYAIYCTSAAGDTLEYMIRRVDELEALIADVKPDGFMFSAGGNDIAGPALGSYLKDYAAGLDDAHLLAPGYAAFLTGIGQSYDEFFGRLARRFPDLHIFCHGYDWALPRRNGRWLGPQFVAKRFPEEAWPRLIRRMIDDFNDVLAGLAAKYAGRVHHVDCRGAIGGLTEWRDELHGRDPGCLRAAGRFRNSIDAVFPDLARAGLSFNPRATAPALGVTAPSPEDQGTPITATVARGIAAKPETEPFAVNNTAPAFVIIEMFGGDNNLDAFVRQDMAEMALATGDDIAVLAIADFARAPASVVEVGRNGPRVIEEWGEIDTGDPEVLSRFLTRALITYPDARKAIGFWDHGTGVFDETDASENLTFRKMASVSRGERSRSRPQRRLFFPKSKLSAQPSVRAMLHDDTNGGILTNIEASNMLSASFRKADVNGKIDLIFSDTCLNGMIEVLEQLQSFAHCVVGSSDLEPGAGWNYTRWLSMMHSAPPATPDDWGKQTVQAFYNEYQSHPAMFPCTMGAFRSGNDITTRFKDLVAVAKTEGISSFIDLDQARACTQGFANRDTYDLQDFAWRVVDMTKSAPVKAAAGDLAAACDRARVDAIALGDMVARSTGLAFWFPGSVSSFLSTAETYRRLAFNEKTGWIDFLEQFRGNSMMRR
jgi:hypothetical protein